VAVQNDQRTYSAAPGAAVAPENHYDYGESLTFDEQESTFDLRTLLHVIRANAVVIAIIFAGALAVAIVVTMLMTPQYTAETTVQINDQTAQVLGKSADADTSDSQQSNAMEAERFLETQLEIINSRALAQRVVQRLNLVGNPDFYKSMGKRMPRHNPTRRELEEDVIKILLKAEKGTLPHNSRLASIQFTAPDANFAAKVANVWATEYIQANLQRRYDSSAYARDFIQGQLTDAKAKLEKSERDLNSYARAAGLIKTREANPGGTGSSNGGSSDASAPNSVTAASLLQQNFAANQAEQQRITAEQRWLAVSKGDLLNTPEVLANAAVSQLLQERAHDEADLQRERTRHTDDYPSVKQLKAAVDTVNHQLVDVAKNVRGSIKQQYEAAVENENRLKSEVQQLKGTSLAEQDRSVQYNLLARDADTNRSLYDNLLQRYKELTAAAGISASNIAIIDSAENPIEPSSPVLLLNLGVGLLAGFALSVLVVSIRQQLDDAVRIPEDIENKLQIPLLGVIPMTGGDLPSIELDDPKSMLSEAYNSLRSSLLFSTASGLPKTLLITSSQAAEGKSTTSMAIARGVAKLGRTVLLVDVDMRRPSAHATMGFDNKRGLSSVLTAQEPFRNAVHATPYENLSVMTSGPIPPSPTDLLSSVAMTRLIAELSQAYDLVIFDSPPVLGLADAPVLSSMVEGVLLIVQADRSRRGSLKSSLRRLQDNHANILGGTLTMFDPKKVSNRYSEYYGYSYYSHYYTDATAQ
jgi:capsular exopolysaccharide synthesis family protein